jgi:hypothetical protein
MPTEIDYLTDPPVSSPVTGAVDGVYSQNTEHAAEGVYNLIEFFKKPRNISVIEAVCSQVQELEDALWSLKDAFNVDTAEGDQLDLLGKLVGEGRDGRTDDQYRTGVRARILVNSSEGTMADFYAIGEAIAKEYNPTFVARDLGYAGLYFEASTTGDATFAQASRLLLKAKAAGVRLHFVSGGDVGAVGDTPVAEGGDGDPAGGTVGDTPISEGGSELVAGFLIADAT